ncbi:MAG: hypothetical protein ROR55_00630 [Devosia sp.]
MGRVLSVIALAAGHAAFNRQPFPSVGPRRTIEDRIVDLFKSNSAR